jgi:hypothetical protein
MGGALARMGETRNAQGIVAGNPEGKISLKGSDNDVLQ